MRQTKRGEFFGTKGELEMLRRKAGAQISVLPIYYTLASATRLYVDHDGTLYAVNEDRCKTLVGQCIPRDPR
jgi:hypothetical protein